MKIFFKLILKLIILIIVFISIGFLYLTLTDYNPKNIEIISENDSYKQINKTKFKILTWNIGYAGLGKEMDFFYDGGEKVRTTKTKTQQNITAIANEISKFKNADFILLQEVDIKSKRTYNINNLTEITKVLPEYINFYATNYRVKYVVVPFSEPMGEVESGIVTFTKYNPISVSRYSLPDNYMWPKKLFMLDRCFLVSRFKLKNNKELLIINTHNSAFVDEDIKTEQLKTISDFVNKEYEKGNYIVVGGDWNKNPPNYKRKCHNKIKNSFSTFQISRISQKIFKNWKFYYDDKTFSNRFLNEPYNKGKTQETVLDMYLCSPNIEKIEIKTLNLEFENSDHNPVILTIKLK